MRNVVRCPEAVWENLEQRMESGNPKQRADYTSYEFGRVESRNGDLTRNRVRFRKGRELT